jgi:hypothetical protein
MLVVSLAIRQPDAIRAPAIAPLWLDPANLHKAQYGAWDTLTDDAAGQRFAPAFWVQQMHFFNADFGAAPLFEPFFFNQRDADAAYCAAQLGEPFRYGLTAGVSLNEQGNDVYAADRIGDHHFVFSPAAVAAWGDLETLLDFYRAQQPDEDPRFRYGLTRVSSLDPAWVPADTALVDRLFLMFGLVESRDPLFFRQRLAGQPDVDEDGIADLYDDCPEDFDPQQADADGDGAGDVCDNCAALFNEDQGDADEDGFGDRCDSPGDGDHDGDVDPDDFELFISCVTAAGVSRAPECVEADLDRDNDVDQSDFGLFQRCLTGPDEPPIPACAT